MFTDLINTSILTINGTEVCRIWSLDLDFRKEVVMKALGNIAPESIDAVPQKFWEFIAKMFNEGQRIWAIKLVQTIAPELRLGEAKELTEFIASVKINH